MRHRQKTEILNNLSNYTQQDSATRYLILAFFGISAVVLALALKTGEDHIVTHQELAKAVHEIEKLALRQKKLLNVVSELEQSNKKHNLLVVELHQLKQDMENLERELQEEIAELKKTAICPGSNVNQPASSCQQILSCDLSSSSGNYWIASADGNATEVHCSMNRVCWGVSGGWMRVAELDMRNSSSQCPSGLREVEHSGHRLCEKDIDDQIYGGCSHTMFKVNAGYSQVCGKIIAYQFGTPDSFGLHPPSRKSIDEGYLDGISLTYSMNPRKHIWSFAAAANELGTFPHCNCPCTNITSAANSTPPPNFVGNDYFCDTGGKDKLVGNHLFSDNPLWDGAGCGPDNTCCSLNNPPWFFKQLQSSTSEDIEMRVCCNQERFDENIHMEQIELYVR